MHLRTLTYRISSAPSRHRIVRAYHWRQVTLYAQRVPPQRNPVLNIQVGGRGFEILAPQDLKGDEEVMLGVGARQ